MTYNIPCYNCLVLPICMSKYFSYKGPGHPVAFLTSNCTLLKSYIFNYEHFEEILEKRIKITKYLESVKNDL